MSGKKTRRIAIGLITNEKDDVLMGLRNDTQKWTTPAGTIEEGEDPFMGMSRELLEETGLNAEKMELVEAKFKDNMLLYLFKIEVDPDQKVDTSGDPDKECDDFTYENPFDHIEELHVPADRNMALKYWAEN